MGRLTEQLQQKPAGRLSQSISTPTPQPEKSGYQKFSDTLGQFSEGVVQGAGSTIFGIGKLGTKLGRALLPKFAEPTSTPYEGAKPNILTPKTTAQKVGFGAEQAGEFFLPSSVVSKGEKGIQALLETSSIAPKLGLALKILGGATLEGIGAGVIRAGQTGSVEEGKRTALISGAVSVPFKALAALSQPTADVLQASAERKMSQALGATTKQNKITSDKIVPALLSRRISFFTRKGLDATADEGVDAAGAALEQGYAALPTGSKVAIAPVLHELEGLKSSLMVAGTNTVPAAALPKYQALQNIQREMIQIANGQSEVPIETIRNYRQILDQTIRESGGGFGFTGSEKGGLLATKAMANSIRSELANQYPNIAKLNAEFNFWSNVKEVIGATIQRTKSQNPLGETLAEGTGAVVGAVKGRGVGDVILGAMGLKLLANIVKSPGWRSVSAVTRAKLADALASNGPEAINILTRLINSQIASQSQR